MGWYRGNPYKNKGIPYCIGMVFFDIWGACTARKAEVKLRRYKINRRESRRGKNERRDI